MNQINNIDCDEKKDNTWLTDFRENITSQYGEDGIISKVLEIIGENDKWCVEFGSWDGKNCSNTYNLITNKDYSAIMIEGDKKRYKNLIKTFETNKKVLAINAFIGFEEHNRLDSVLKTTSIPNNFDLLSIDIDGNDYHVWDAFKDYKPKVVIIEFNPTIAPQVNFIQPKDMSITQGSSLLSITTLAKSKGYQLVATTTTNAIFVDDVYFDRFGIANNSAEEMMWDKSLITHLFCGYDGTVFIRGYGIMPWQTITIKESRVQQLPAWARKKIGDRNFIRRKLGKIFRRLRKKEII